ncbi:hypothetical protein GDO86_011727 [Hymenochirus boettgeri]|uniref:Mitochondrial assembly of ribosomal large subunit protein 1 n=1 Tax=Hymenochirus boettgeri TaxID=247094 RepID=A0A8T2JHJ1_9PIPI|nr:hypothetical protein GDO86_011727 [Hymenochirus boettgeri]
MCAPWLVRLVGYGSVSVRGSLSWRCQASLRLEKRKVNPLLVGLRAFSSNGLNRETLGLIASHGQHGDPREEQERTLIDNCFPSFDINTLVSLLRQENGKDLCVIRLPSDMKYADYFVVVSGYSTRHIQAMAQYALKVYKYIKKDEPHVRIEGKDTDDWMCIDFGNVIVHFMLPETRELYELEKLWTLRSFDDQLSCILPEILPSDFTFGFQSQNK